jgi:hypothetical protein
LSQAAEAYRFPEADAAQLSCVARGRPPQPLDLEQEATGLLLEVVNNRVSLRQRVEDLSDEQLRLALLLTLCAPWSGYSLSAVAARSLLVLLTAHRDPHLMVDRVFGLSRSSSACTLLQRASWSCPASARSRTSRSTRRQAAGESRTARTFSSRETSIRT